MRPSRQRSWGCWPACVATLGVTVLLISHNLAVVTEVCDRVGVLYAGRLVEQGPVADVFAAPAHPYTRGLLASLPQPGSRQERRAVAAIGGQPHSAAAQLPGCTFAPRCTFARPACSQAEPALLARDRNADSSRCYFWEEVLVDHGLASAGRPTPRGAWIGRTSSSSDATRRTAVCDGRPQDLQRRRRTAWSPSTASA